MALLFVIMQAMSSSDNDRIEPRLLKGFRDLLPEKLLQRNQLITTISQTLASFGFLPLETPALEYAEILEGKLGDESEKLLYKFADHGGRQVALRYDFTVPLARVAAQYPDLPKPFKRYQVGPVWRADNTQRGRYREFYQFDMDIVGADSTLADAEILVLMQEVLLAIGVKNFKIRVNSRQTLALLAKESKLNENQLQVFYAGLDKWDKIGGDAVFKLWNDGGISSSQIDQLKNLLELNEGMNAQLTQTLNRAYKLGLKHDHVTLDPRIVRGLDYYTGIVFETTLTDAPEFGSIFSGGRYDGLIGRFAKQQIPAVGTSVGLDRLMAAMDELKLLPQNLTSTQVFVTVFNADLAETSLEVASKLRQQGINTEVSYQTENLGKQLKLAAAKNIRYAIIIGPDEAENNHLVVRNLESGQEQKLTVGQAIKTIKVS